MQVLEFSDSDNRPFLIDDFLSILNRDAFDELPTFFNSYIAKMAPKSLSEKIICFIEGNIAIGKSTFLNNFVHSKYPIIEEPTKLWSNIKNKHDQKDCLEIFYSELEKVHQNKMQESNFITKFQVIALFTRLFNVFTCIEENKENMIFFSERSIATDR